MPNYLKTIVLVSITLAFSAGCSSLARAASPTAKALEKKVAKAETVDKSFSGLQTRGLKEVDRRIAALNKVNTRLGMLKKLAADTKTKLTADIQAEIESLNALRAKIEADTDLETLKNDVKSIVSSYRIYLLYIPKIHLLASADITLTVADSLNSIADRLDALIQKASGDTTSLETTLKDMRDKIAEAKAGATTAQTLLLSLKAEDYPTNKSSLEEARKTLKTAREALKAAYQDAKTILNSLDNGVGSLKSLSSPTVSPSPSPSVSPKS